MNGGLYYISADKECMAMRRSRKSSFTLTNSDRTNCVLFFAPAPQPKVCDNQADIDCSPYAACYDTDTRPEGYSCQCLSGFRDQSPSISLMPGRVCEGKIELVIKKHLFSFDFGHWLSQGNHIALMIIATIILIIMDICSAHYLSERHSRRLEINFANDGT